MLVCMRCAGPVIVAKARADQNEVERSTQRVYWDELCAMLQMGKTTLKCVRASEEDWPRQRADIMKRGKFAALKGETVLDEAGRAGKVALVLPPTAGQEEPAGVYICWIVEAPKGKAKSAKGKAKSASAARPKTVFWSVAQAVEGCGRARRATQLKNEEQLAKSLITKEEIIVASQVELVVIEDLGGAVYTTPIDGLFEVAAQISVWKKDVNGKLFCRQAKVEKSKPLEQARETEFEKLVGASESMVEGATAAETLVLTPVDRAQPHCQWPEGASAWR